MNIKCLFGFHDIDYQPIVNLRYPTVAGHCKRCGKYKSHLSSYPFKPYPNSDEVIIYRAKIDSEYNRKEATRLFNEKHGLSGVKITKDNKQLLIDRASDVASSTINRMMFKSALDVDINVDNGTINVSVDLSQLRRGE